MSFFKSIARVVHPLSRLFLHDKKKGGPADTSETPEQIQQKWEDELKGYGNIASESQQGAIDRAKAAGTYSPTTAFQESLGAEAGAATRQLQGASQARQDALKKRYEELVASNPKKYKGMSPSLGVKPPTGTV